MPAEGRGLSTRSTPNGARTGRLMKNLEPSDQVRKLQEALHAKTKSAPSYHFYLLYDKVYRPDVLVCAYRRCRGNRGVAGVDHRTFDDIAQYGVEQWLGELAQQVSRTYRVVTTRGHPAAS